MVGVVGLPKSTCVNMKILLEIPRGIEDERDSESWALQRKNMPSGLVCFMRTALDK